MLQSLLTSRRIDLFCDSQERLNGRTWPISFHLIEGRGNRQADNTYLGVSQGSCSTDQEFLYAPCIFRGWKYDSGHRFRRMAAAVGVRIQKSLIDIGVCYVRLIVQLVLGVKDELVLGW